MPKESSIPQDVLSHFNTAFKYAKQGNKCIYNSTVYSNCTNNKVTNICLNIGHRVTDLGYTIFGQPFLGSLRNAGFLYVKSSFQVK
jgi:hypothetical protein